MHRHLSGERVSRLAGAGGVAIVAAVMTSVAAQDRGGLHVCVGPDRVVRYEAAAQCPAGQVSHRLVEAADDLSAEPEKEADAKIAELRKIIDNLSVRLSSLERTTSANASSSSRVFAPFEVVDKQGNAILRVSDEPVPTGLKSKARVLLTRGSGNNYILQFLTASGVYASSVGESAAGYGVLHLHDQGGSVRVRADAKDGLVLFNPAALPVGRLSFGPKGGGYLQLAEPGGAPMVEAGAFADGVGRVIAGPNFKCQGNAAALGLGLPDCIKGRK